MEQQKKIRRKIYTALWKATNQIILELSKKYTCVGLQTKKATNFRETSLYKNIIQKWTFRHRK